MKDGKENNKTDFVETWNKPVTIQDQADFEFVKTKRGEYHFYHGKCIDKYFGIDTKPKKEVI